MGDPIGGPTEEELEREDELQVSADVKQQLLGHDIRLRRLERFIASMDKTVALTDRSVQGIVTTIESRFKAFDAAQALALEIQQSMRKELQDFTSLKQRGEGAIWILKLIGFGSVIGFVVWLFKTIQK